MNGHSESLRSAQITSGLTFCYTSDESFFKNLLARAGGHALTPCKSRSNGLRAPLIILADNYSSGENYERSEQRVHQTIARSSNYQARKSLAPMATRDPSPFDIRMPTLLSVGHALACHREA